jgi:hypothetical protein
MPRILRGQMEAVEAADVRYGSRLCENSYIGEM